MIATATAPVAAKFSRIVVALVGAMLRVATGAEWNFVVAEGVEIVAWTPRAGHITLQIQEFDGAPVRTATVCPGVERTFDVVSDGVLIGETHGAEAAMSIALDHLVAVLRGNAQHTPDPCGV